MTEKTQNLKQIGGRPGQGRLLATAFVVTVFFVLASWAGAYGQSGREIAIKAGFIFNFAKFVSWPKPASFSAERFIFCVGGKKEFSHIFRKAVSDKKIGGNKILVLDMGPEDDSSGCNILYVPHTEPVVVDKFLAGIVKESVLSIGDAEDFLNRGGVIRFYAEKDKLRFEIGLTNANRSGLSISSELLSLAKVRP